MWHIVECSQEHGTILLGSMEAPLIKTLDSCSILLAPSVASCHIAAGVKLDEKRSTSDCDGLPSDSSVNLTRSLPCFEGRALKAH